MIKTLKLKVHPDGYNWLSKAAREVNCVWNWCNETSIKASDRTRSQPKWMSGFDLCYLSAGATVCFDHIGADTIQVVCTHYAQKRRQFKKRSLRWRVSSGSRRSLGFVPFKAASLKRKGNALRFCGKTFRVFERDRLPEKWKAGCFAQDAMGDWWLCLPVEIEDTTPAPTHEAVGVDLGLKAIATTSDGDTLATGRFYRDVEQKIAQSQRRGHKRRAKRLHRKAANRRKDALHKFSRALVNKYEHIVIGDVSSTKLVKTRMAKSVLDSGWGMLKTQIQYKGQQAGRCVEVVSERYTTQACSACGSISGPRGQDMLVVREWVCGDCGVSHQRDVNAAQNILALRFQRPFAGTSFQASDARLERASAA